MRNLCMSEPPEGNHDDVFITCLSVENSLMSVIELLVKGEYDGVTKYSC